ncbi:hypothetical protein SCLCIDRAFT_124053 [Scleroderma citrinum Foug A]|uniref:FAD/NAD(P)-binding domain-containing protein n=1 Tax=Scleroderma citrinum Foug A TaxID=1036808 RepID=A0A0C3DIF1_9AGAM|nr:hypothetical protein SCLCIDRAFT_124053 [Scleroderma citrinum Foug A]
MSSPPSFDIPTLDDLGVDPTVLGELSPTAEATKWFAAFRTNTHDKTTGLVTGLFHELGFWKDVLALTWNYRTIRGARAIKHLLDARLAQTGLEALSLAEDSFRAPTLLKPTKDVVFLRLCFEFETNYGRGTAVAFLVPTSGAQWKAWSLLTCLESLKDYPERVGPLRDSRMDYEWEERRHRELNLADGDPTVLVIGAGHTGLEIAARLKYMSVSTLVIDKHTRIGDNWRTRYKSLCLHDTCCKLFPSTWPVHCPSSKLGDWLEFYATALELNVWLSTKVASASWNAESKTWSIVIHRNGDVRRMTVNHLIFATGYGGGFPKIPDIEGKDIYNGKVLHSFQYMSPLDFTGKRAVVVGACTSAHDIAHDLYRHGLDVTMIQRSSTCIISLDALKASLQGKRYNEHFPVDFADVLGHALPWPSLRQLLKHETLRIASTTDKDLLSGLEKVGFRTNLGIDGAGPLSLIFAFGGGFYIADTGACREIISGNIKIKSGCSVRRFVSHGLELEDGTELECDVVIFATGFGDLRDSIREICGPDVAKKVGPVWGLDDEGEHLGRWRRTGQPHLWIGMGNLSRSRFHSLHLALQIKALEEGLTTEDEIYVD